MHPRLYIAAACLLCTLWTGCTPKGKVAWQATLDSELEEFISTRAYMVDPPDISGMHAHHAVPAKVALILESHPKAELRSYLSELRKNAAPFWRQYVLDRWIEVAASGARGEPQTVTYMRGVYQEGTSWHEIAVYKYSIPMMRQLSPAKLPNPALDRMTTAGDTGSPGGAHTPQ